MGLHILTSSVSVFVCLSVYYAVLVDSAENDDAGDEAVTITVEEAVEKLGSCGIEVRMVPTMTGASRTSAEARLMIKFRLSSCVMPCQHA